MLGNNTKQEFWKHWGLMTDWGLKLALSSSHISTQPHPSKDLIEIKPQLIVMPLTPHFYIVFIPSSPFLLGLSTFVRLILLAQYITYYRNTPVIIARAITMLLHEQQMKPQTSCIEIKNRQSIGLISYQISEKRQMHTSLFALQLVLF